MMSDEPVFTVTEIVHTHGDNAAFETGVLLVAFNNAEEANNFARAHSDEIELEMKADIKAEVERHLLSTTGRRVLAEVEDERILFWTQKGEGNDITMRWASPNSAAGQEIKTRVNDLFRRTYPSYSVRKALVDRAWMYTSMNTKSFRVASMKTRKTHETMVARLRVEGMLLY